MRGGLPERGPMLARLPNWFPVSTARYGKNGASVVLNATGQVSAVTRVAQLVQNLFRRDQVGRAKTLGKAAINRPKAGDGIGGAPLFAQQAGKARCRPQFPGQGAPPLRDGAGLPETRPRTVPMAKFRP